MKIVTILGSTGSIGTNTLDVIRRNQHQYQVYALAAGRNVDLLASQILEFRPQAAVLETPDGVSRLSDKLTESGLTRAEWPELLSGAAARTAVSTAGEVDTVISAIVGVANKEVLVSGGRLVMEAVRESGALLVPVDSEHNGAHQCLRAGNRGEVSRLILTASGGPFRNTPASELATVTPEQALNHPTWKMGKRITI